MPTLAEDKHTLARRIRVIAWLVWGSSVLLIGATLTERATARSSHLVAGLGLLERLRGLAPPVPVGA
jgi:hypothetical protein